MHIITRLVIPFWIFLKEGFILGYTMNIIIINWIKSNFLIVYYTPYKGVISSISRFKLAKYYVGL
jgi:hypothetical protein